MIPSSSTHDKQKTQLALNMTVAAVQRVVSSEDRIVLDQQYRTIVNRLKIGKIDDDELRSLYDSLLEELTVNRLSQEDRERFERVYDSEQKRLILTALKDTVFDAIPFALPGATTWIALGKALINGASPFFGYPAVKQRLLKHLDSALWQLAPEKTSVFDELQRRLHDARLNFARTYDLSGDAILVQEDFDELEKAFTHPDPFQARAMVSELRERFAAYPLFWFYKGEASLRRGNINTAEEYFTRFDETSCDVLQKDPYKVQIAKYRVMMNDYASRDEIRQQLAVIKEHASHWLDYLFLGIVSFAIGDKEQAYEAVKHNIQLHLEEDLSSLFLTAMTSGIQRLWLELARAYYKGKGVEIDKTAAYRYACLAQMYSEKKAYKLICAIEGKGLFGFCRRPQISETAMADAWNDAQSLFEDERREREERKQYEIQKYREQKQRELHEQEGLLPRKDAEEYEYLRNEEKKPTKFSYKDAKTLEELLREEITECEGRLKEAIAYENTCIAEIAGNSKAAVGSTVTFGRYVQDMIGRIDKKRRFDHRAVKVVKPGTPDKPAPIEWFVLAREGDKALLISKYGLDAKPYHNDVAITTWEKCDLREWLNGEFLYTAFNADERVKIVQVRNLNPDNPQWGTPGDNTTDDRVFLLSIDEVNRYLKYRFERSCNTTAYARSKGASIASDGYIYIGDGADWWLRSPAQGIDMGTYIGDGSGPFNRGGIAYVSFGGYINDNYGLGASCRKNCVRPALWVRGL